jgi:hypothetical protein
MSREIMTNEIILRLNPIQYDLIKAVSNLILLREEEHSNHKKISINASSIARISGRSYVATKKYLKSLKDL